jgi:hypothetical protein
MFTTGSNYFFQPAILSQLIVIVVFLIGSIITRMVLSIKDGRVKLTPTLFGLIGFSVLLLCNGFFNDDFNIFNTLYGAVLVFCFLGIFVLGCGNIKVNDKTFERLAYTFIALGILLMVELAVIYLTYDGIVVDGMVNRSVITFGWGTYNQAGMLFAISTPSALYLACKKNWGWVFTIYSVILLTATFFAMSRQAIVAVPIVFVIGTIVTLGNC